MKLSSQLDPLPEPFRRRYDAGGGAPERELAPSRGAAQELRGALARYQLETGIPATPRFHQLVERWRKEHAPEIPLTLLVAFSAIESEGWNDVTNGTARHGYADTEAYELGIFQVPTGLHGHCTGRNACAHRLPGPDPHNQWPWRRLCARFGYDPERWQDRTAQVRVGRISLRFRTSCGSGSKLRSPGIGLDHAVAERGPRPDGDVWNPLPAARSGNGTQSRRSLAAADQLLP